MRYVLLALLTFASTVTCQSNGLAAQDASKWARDLAMFRTQFFEKDKSYSGAERASAEALLQQLEADPDELSVAEFHLALARIAALTGNAHTALFNPNWTQLFNRIDVQFFVGADGLFIGGARGELSELVGKRVDRVEGMRLAELRRHWARYQSGSEGWRDVFLPYFLESPEVLHAAGIAERSDRVSLTLGDGRVIIVEVGTQLDPLTGMSAVIPPPRAMTLVRMGFAPATPIYLQEPDKIVRRIDLPDHGAVYIQYRANMDFTGSVDVRSLSEQIARDLRDDPPSYVILDQRMNFGGDLNNTRNLMQTIPEVVGAEGHVYILVSGRTFSAGISSTGYAKQAGGDRVTIIGTPVGDDLEFWSEGDFVSLPVSGAKLLYSTERHNYMTGCQEADCHGSIRRNPIRVTSLEPDEPAAMTYEDLVAGRDPLLEKALRLIEAHRE